MAQESVITDAQENSKPHDHVLKSKLERMLTELYATNAAALFGTATMPKIYAALLTQSGDGTSTATNGTLSIGKRYKITSYVEGDDFTNVGAATNETDVEFIATETTPTVWTNSSELTDTAAPVATVLVNTLSAAPVWTRAGAADYDATLEGEFTVGKTLVLLPATVSFAAATWDVDNSSADVVKVLTETDDGDLSSTPILILVFP